MGNREETAYSAVPTKAEAEAGIELTVATPLTDLSAQPSPPSSSEIDDICEQSVIVVQRGEAQSPQYRDKWFAVAFLVMVLLVLGLSIVFVPAVLEEMAKSLPGVDIVSGREEEDEDEDKYNTGDYSISVSGHEHDDDWYWFKKHDDWYEDEKNNEDSVSVPLPAFWTIAAVSFFVTPVISIVAFFFLSRNPSCIQYIFWAASVLGTIAYGVTSTSSLIEWVFIGVFMIVYLVRCARLVQAEM